MLFNNWIQASVENILEVIYRWMIILYIPRSQPVAYKNC